MLVMNYGVAAEYDTPLKLLEIENGIFKSLVEADGPDTTLRLTNLARGMTSPSTTNSPTPVSTEPVDISISQIKLERAS